MLNQSATDTSYLSTLVVTVLRSVSCQGGRPCRMSKVAVKSGEGCTLPHFSCIFEHHGHSTPPPLLTILSQWRDLRMGVIWEDVGALTTVCAVFSGNLETEW